MNVKSVGQNTAFSTNKTLRVGGRILDLTTPRVMGILNITPDSFFEGSRITTETALLKQAEKMLSEGASILDVGGYSSRPGADDVSETEELKRSCFAIKLLAREFPDSILSIDTFRAEVARQAILEGASMINDISAGELDSKMFSVAAESKVPYIAMHMKGTPQSMKSETDYADLIKDITDYFHKKISVLRLMGVTDIIIDPGFGFAKTIDQNFTLLNHLEHFKIFGTPLMVGISRKSMVWKSLETKPEDALNGTTALHMIALLKGACILRVHDVKPAAETIRLYQKTVQK